MKDYDVLIVGGGAAGIMAAVSAKRNNPEQSVAIVDRTFALGRKILVCGAGRCNITNVNLNTGDYSKFYYGASEDFIKDTFDQFGYEDIVKFFEDLGIELYTERKTDIGKVFPTTNQAKTVTELLIDELTRLEVEVFLNTEVHKISKVGDKFQINAEVVEKDKKTGDKRDFTTTKLIMTTGGKTYPALGSNGSGYNLVKNLGHSIIQPVPSALPITASDQLIHKLQGVKFEVEVTSFIDDKQVKTRTDDVMFTNYGLSGPAILNVSREISIHFNRENKNNCIVSLNFLPGKTRDEVFKIIESRWKKRPEQTIEKSLFGLFPNKFAAAILDVLKIEKNKTSLDLTEDEKKELVANLVDYRIKVTGTRGWNEGEFTAGGIDTSEVNSKTLESKIVSNLFFAGEILNVDGDVGGFNLSWSWSSGVVSGKK